MKSHRLLAVVTALALLVSSVAACAPTEKIVTKEVEKVVTKEIEKQVVVTATPEPALGTKLPIPKARVALNGAVPTLDTTITMLTPAGQMVLLTGGYLFRFDKNRIAQPELVDTYTISNDGLVYTMKLHAGLKFNDGTPLKASDVVFSFNRIKDAVPTNKLLIQYVTKVEAPDDQTVVWTLSQPEGDFTYFFAMYFMPVLPQAKVEGDKDYFLHPLSAGPYYIKEGKPGDSLFVLAENPNYVHGPMSIQSIDMSVTPDQTSRTLQLGQGDLDFVYELPPSVRGVLAKGVTTYPHNIGGVIHLVFNLRQPPSSPAGNNDVRHAISLALDRNEISQKAFFGVALPTEFVVPSMAAERIPVLPNGGKQDLAAAKALLANTPCKDGCNMTLQTWSDRAGWPEAATVIKEQLAKVGINVTIDSIPSGVSFARMPKGDFDFTLGGSGLGPLRVFLANQYLQPMFWTSCSGYDSPKMIALFDQLSKETDPNKRVDILKQIQQLGFDDMPILPLLDRNILIGTRLPTKVFTVIAGDNTFWVAKMSEVQ